MAQHVFDSFGSHLVVDENVLSGSLFILLELSWFDALGGIICWSSSWVSFSERIWTQSPIRTHHLHWRRYRLLHFADILHVANIFNLSHWSREMLADSHIPWFWHGLQLLRAVVVIFFRVYDLLKILLFMPEIAFQLDFVDFPTFLLFQIFNSRGLLWLLAIIQDFEVCARVSICAYQLPQVFVVEWMKPIWRHHIRRTLSHQHFRISVAWIRHRLSYFCGAVVHGLRVLVFLFFAIKLIELISWLRWGQDFRMAIELVVLCFLYHQTLINLLSIWLNLHPLPILILPIIWNGQVLLLGYLLQIILIFVLYIYLIYFILIYLFHFVVKYLLLLLVLVFSRFFLFFLEDVQNLIFLRILLLLLWTFIHEHILLAYIIRLAHNRTFNCRRSWW